MPSTVTISQISGGQNGNFVLSADKARLFVAGNDGSLRVYNAVTGTLIDTIALGGNLQGIDISPDGSFLIVTDANTVTAGGETTSSFYRVDTASLAAQTHTITTPFNPSSISGLFDVVITAANRALIGMGGINAFGTVYSFDIATGAITQTTIGRPGGNINISPDNTVILLGDVGVSPGGYYGYDTEGRFLGSTPFASIGVTLGVEALSPGGNLMAVAGGGGESVLYLLNGDLSVQSPSLAGLHAGSQYVVGLAFNSDGSVLYVLTDAADRIFGIRMSDRAVVEEIALPADVYPRSQFGDELLLSPDEGSFFIRSSTGIIRVDRVNVATGTSGDDTFTGVTYGDNYQGLDGSDTIAGGRGNDLLNGGAGNDTISGGFGDDELTGGANNDTIDGGAGSGDVAVFSGNRADYTIDTSTPGVVTITGSGASAGDGSDTLRRVEIARFADMSVQLPAEANTPPALGPTAMPDQTVPDQAAYTYQVPADAFVELDANDPLTYRAELYDGAGLPYWLSFDPVTRTFTGTPPASAIGSTFLVRVHAADRGTEISDTFALSIQMGGGSDIVGTPDADLLDGTFRPETIFGLDGDDLIMGSDSPDTIDGGGGSDDTVLYLNSPTGVTVDLAAGTGLGGFAEGDILIGIEAIVGSQNDDILLGNDAANYLEGFMGVDTLSGRGGNDFLVIDFNGAGSHIDGGTGFDTLSVSGQAWLGSLVSIEAIRLSVDPMLPATPILFLSGTQFKNGLALNTAVSGTGQISVDMSPGVFFLSKLFTFSAGIVVAVNGTSGTDVLKMGNAPHVVAAGDGTDQIKGGSQVDTIDGGAGIDKIMGLGGADFLTGGLGNDVFRYLAQSDSGPGAAADTITDFTIGQDRINFAQIDTNPGLAGVQGFAFAGTAAFAGGGLAQVRYLTSGSDLIVQADVNGDGAADMEIILQGLAGQSLTSAQFVLGTPPAMEPPSAKGFGSGIDVLPPLASAKGIGASEGFVTQDFIAFQHEAFLHDARFSVWGFVAEPWLI